MVGLHIVWYYFVYTAKMMLPSLPLLEMAGPIVGIIATNNWCTCDVHHLGFVLFVLLNQIWHLQNVLQM